MAIVFSCPRCDQRYSVPETMAGRRVTCKKCGQERTVPGVVPTAAPPPTPAARPPVRPVNTFRDEPPVYDEDDDLDKPLDDFDELPATSALMPRPKKPSYTAPAPKPSKKKVVRRQTDDVVLPPIVNVGLGLIGLLMLFGLGALVVDASNKGNPNAVGIGVALAIGLASIGVMMVSMLKVVFHANEYSGTLTALACFFIPCFILGYIVINFNDTKRYLMWYAGGVVGIIITALMLPSFADSVDREGEIGESELPPALMAMGAEPGKTVVLRVKGLDDPVSRDLFGQKLNDLVRTFPGNRGTAGGSPVNGMSQIAVWPVTDPKGFAAILTFAKGAKVSGRTITLTADLSEADLADARQVKADEDARAADVKAALDAQAAAAKPKTDPDNPFQEKTADNPFQEKPKPAAPAMTFDPNAGPIDKLLHETRNPDGFKAREAIKALAAGVPEERKAEVVSALIPLLGLDVFTMSETLKALAALKTPEAAAAILPMLDDQAKRGDAIKALMQMGDPRAAEAIAEHLKDGWPYATEALTSFGPEAESAVVPKLSDPDATVRQRALDVLSEIGGVATIQTMRALPADEDGIVRMKANNAMKKILQRTGPVPQAK